MQAESGSSIDERRHRGPGGRPRADQAGDVDRRILRAAAELFLQLGFDAASCEQIAARARASKASLYARYGNKEALFQAVVRDKVGHALRPVFDRRLDLPLRERLQAVGEALLLHVLQPDNVAFMRVVFTAAHRMPDLARTTFDIGRRGGIAVIATALVGHKDASAAALEQAEPIAAKFLDLAFLPQQMRALLGDETAVLQAAAPGRVAEAIELLAGAGWLRRWE